MKDEVVRAHQSRKRREQEQDYREDSLRLVSGRGNVPRRIAGASSRQGQKDERVAKLKAQPDLQNS